MVFNKAKKIVCIIQARMGSTRLPGKIFLPLAGKTILEQVIDRVLQSEKISEAIVATTTAKRDDAIVSLLSGYHPKVSIERGSEDDVLDRYFQAAKKHKADVIVRITSDNPFIDPDIMDMIIETLENDSSLDYVSNSIGKHTFPRGLDVEAFTFEALQRCFNEGKEVTDREHVTIYIKRSPNIFKTQSFENDVDLSGYRWTVDEKDDYVLAQALYDRLFKHSPRFRMGDVISLLKREPKLININKHVEQKNPKY